MMTLTRRESVELAVVVADGNPTVRCYLTTLLNSESGIQVVAEASTGREAVREVLSHHVDVFVVDLRLRDHSGATTIKDVLRCAPDVAVLVFTALDDDESVTTALRVGARGYFLKGTEHICLVRAVRDVAAGSALFCPSIAGRLGRLLPDATSAHVSLFSQLTERELEVLELVASGLPNTVIARRLRLSSKTIRNYTAVIVAKLQVAGRTEAIVRAQEAGLG